LTVRSGVVKYNNWKFIKANNRQVGAGFGTKLCLALRRKCRSGRSP